MEDSGTITEEINNSEPIPKPSQDISQTIDKKKRRSKKAKKTFSRAKITCAVCGKEISESYQYHHYRLKHPDQLDTIKKKGPDKPVEPEESKNNFSSALVNRLNDGLEKVETHAEKKIFKEEDDLKGVVESPKNNFILKLIISGGALLFIGLIIVRSISVKMARSQNESVNVRGPAQNGPYIDNNGRRYGPGEYHHDY